MPPLRLRPSFARPITRPLAAATFGIALAVLIQPGAGFAYTPEQQQACSPDAMRLCGDFVPNVDAITACMIQKKAQLSPQCKVYFRQGPEPDEARAGKPARKSTKPAAKASKKTEPS